MNMFQLTQIESYLPETYAMICFSSFETRCKTIINSINKKHIQKLYVIRNIDQDMIKEKEENHDNITNICDACCQVDVTISDPVILAKKLLFIVNDIKKNKLENIVVDITTFTHEALMIFLKGISMYIGELKSFIAVYNPALRYEKWLSKGCKEVRNIMGYPGCNIPTRKDHLIVLTGFEQERATQLVEEYEPDFLSIGYGIEPTNMNHQPVMDEKEEEFKTWFSNLSVSWTSFLFSCSDIDKTIEILEEQVQEIIKAKRNIQLASLNTKISTIAAAIVAIREPRIQMIYPIPESYNSKYAEPSDNVISIDLKAYF